MHRVFSMLLVVAVANALLAASAGAAWGAGPEQGTEVLVKLDLEASNGLRAHLENSDDGIVTLELRKKRQFVSYQAPGEVSEGGLKVSFGRLGMIDVAFSPTSTLSSTEPGDGCTGAPRTLREGIFAGTIAFTGERGFVRIGGTQATGSMSVISQWVCPELEAKTPMARLSRFLARASGDRKHESESATLTAARRGCSCYFVAGIQHRRSGGKSVFFGIKIEEREGVTIVRATEVRGPASDFVYDFSAGTATLRAPSPLSGHAHFDADAHGRGRWRSTIRVPLLGSPPIDTSAPGFTAALRPEYQF